jgi:hypothetical protein
MTDLMEADEFAARIKQTRDWVIRNYRDIPHHRIGKRVKFSEQDLADYLTQTSVQPRPMTTRRKKRG